MQLEKTFSQPNLSENSIPRAGLPLQQQERHQGENNGQNTPICQEVSLKARGYYVISDEEIAGRWRKMPLTPICLKAIFRLSGVSNKVRPIRLGLRDNECTLCIFSHFIITKIEQTQFLRAIPKGRTGKTLYVK